MMRDEAAAINEKAEAVAKLLVAAADALDSMRQFTTTDTNLATQTIDKLLRTADRYANAYLMDAEGNY